MKRYKQAAIILVGDELLSGERKDSHLFFLSRELKSIGFQIAECCVLKDDLEQVAGAVRSKAGRSDVLIVCGGLGPTADDLTAEGVAKGLNKPLELNDSVSRKIRTFFKVRGYKFYPLALKQAYLPKGSTVIPNTQGTAPGFYIEKYKSLIIVLPGPPREVQPMVKKTVIPLLKKRYKGGGPLSKTFRTAGVIESELAEILEPIYERYDIFRFSSLPQYGCVDIVITEKLGAKGPKTAKDAASALAREMKMLLGNKLYGEDEVTLESAVGVELFRKKMTLAVAESLSGGNLGKKLTDVPGSSRYLIADVVAYSNEAKTFFLGVEETILRRHGAVSKQACLEMARGIREKTGATWGLATTGIAGPSGGTKTKPVGLCYYGLSWVDGEIARKSIFCGNREQVRERVTCASLLMLYEKLKES